MESVCWAHCRDVFTVKKWISHRDRWGEGASSGDEGQVWRRGTNAFKDHDSFGQWGSRERCSSSSERSHETALWRGGNQLQGTYPWVTIGQARTWVRSWAFPPHRKATEIEDEIVWTKVSIKHRLRKTGGCHWIVPVDQPTVHHASEVADAIYTYLQRHGDILIVFIYFYFIAR